MITKVQLPMSRGSLLLATNQGLLYVLSMVVIGGMAAAGALGFDIVPASGTPAMSATASPPASRSCCSGSCSTGSRRTAAARHGPPARGRLRRRRVDCTRHELEREGRKKMRVKRTQAVLAALVMTSALALGACGGGDSRTPTAGGRQGLRRPEHGRQPLGRLRGQRGYVVGDVARPSSAARSNYKDLDEQVSWKGFGNGTVDVVIENWGHPELQKKYMAERDGTAVEPGSPATRVIGWYVPPWMADKYPDITDWKNLNKYADLFKTPESGNLGTFSTATRRSSPTTRRW